MKKQIEIIELIQNISGIEEINFDSDIFSLGVKGDDFHEMIEKYAQIFEVNMDEYLWYFHTDEEGQNFGAFLFKPPYSRIDRIPITPRLLSEFATTKKWNIDYPKHELPKRRIDIIINLILIIVLVLMVLTIWIVK